MKSDIPSPPPLSRFGPGTSRAVMKLVQNFSTGANSSEFIMPDDPWQHLISSVFRVMGSDFVTDAICLKVTSTERSVDDEKGGCQMDRGF